MKKKIILILVVISFFLFSSIALSASKAEVKPEKNINLAFLNADGDKQNPEIRRRGCCYGHGGVCGCKKGRVVCCDGKYSRCKCWR